MCKRPGDAPALDLSALSEEQLTDLVSKARVEKKSRITPEQAAAKAERKATRKDRAKANQPRQVPGNGRRKVRKGIAPVVTPSQEPDKALQQLADSFGKQWVDNASNPAVELISSEHTLCARLNVYSGGRWASRRLGDDNVIALVKLKDGTQETRRFTRSVLSEEWKRS